MREIDPGNVVLWFVAFLLSLTIHEFAHAWTSEKFGDDTGRYTGRVSLNPLVHIDPVGTVIFPLMGLFYGWSIPGWAKPVPVNPDKWHDKVIANIAVSAAGPISNLLLALGAGLSLKVMLMANVAQFARHPGSFVEGITWFLVQMFELNVILAAFNFLPIPPLDGSHILSSILSVVSPPLMEAYERLRDYGFIILMVLSVSGLLSYLFLPVRDVVRTGLFYVIGYGAY